MYKGASESGLCAMQKNTPAKVSAALTRASLNFTVHSAAGVGGGAGAMLICFTDQLSVNSSQHSEIELFLNGQRCPPKKHEHAQKLKCVLLL